MEDSPVGKEEFSYRRKSKTYKEFEKSTTINQQVILKAEGMNLHPHLG